MSALLSVLRQRLAEPPATPHAQTIDGDAALIVFSDTHIGSILSAWPGSVEVEKTIWTPNKVQEWIAERWQEWWTWARKEATGRRTIVIANGDLCQGNAFPVELMPDSLAVHRRAAAEHIKTVLKADDRVLIIRGTRAHSGAEGENEESIAEVLYLQDVQVCKDGATYSHYVAWLNVNGILVNIAHHIGTSQSPVSEGTALTSQMVNMLRDSARWDTRPADIILRAHRHTCSVILGPGRGSGFAVATTPAWTARGEYGSKVNPTSPSQVGGLVVQIDRGGQWDIKRRVWALPHPEPEVL